MKECTKCGRLKHLTEFHNNRRKKDGKENCCKVCVKIRTDKWNSENKERVKESNAAKRAGDFGTDYQRKVQGERRIQDPKYRMYVNLKSRTSIACKKFDRNIKGMANYLCCTKEALYDYIEVQFRDGMSWDNYAEVWELDHIKPMCSATSNEEVLKLNHYTNLQPLLIEEHKEKTKNEKKLRYSSFC